MRQTRKCAFCGKEFTSGNGMKKYCCERWAEEARHGKKDGKQNRVGGKH